MAEIFYVVGDATDPADDSPKVVVHVCNNIGKWGAGFTRALDRRWPAAHKGYENWAARDPNIFPPFDLGEVRVHHVGGGIHIANMIAQRGVRSASNPRPLDYAALAVCLIKVAGWAMGHGASVHMPRIGCGLAGGSWDVVELLIQDALCARGVPVTVYDLPTRPAAKAR